MILTEEQRAAIKLAMKYIARWPFAYKELHARGVLQAMIDSSEHIREPPKMVGFDLVARIRELEAENVQLLAALDESERVVAHKTKSAAHWYDEHLQARADRVQTRRVVEQQAARIKELEDALIEQEARFQYYVQNENCESWPEARRRYPELNEKYLKIARQHLQAEGKIGPDADAKPREGLYGKYCISKADDSPVDPNADYFVLRLDTDPVARRAAREYSYVTPDRDLARGLQDRLAKYDPQLKDCMNIRFFGLEKPQVWQITEERKAVILHCKRMLTFLKEDDAPCYDVEKITKDESVLVAMLEDAK